MRMVILSAGAAVVVWSLAGCTPVEPGAAMKSDDYQARPSLTMSLFKSDQAVLGEDAIAKIMSSKIDLPDQAKIAVFRIAPERGARDY